MKRLILLILLLSMTMLVTAQQEGGQACVQAFEDRNSNGIQDGNEANITEGLNANLNDANNITIQSILMEDSPNASRGVLCFQFLPSGTYQIQITSTDYAAVSSNVFTVEVSETGVPTLVQFPAQRIVTGIDTSGASTSSSATDRDTLAGLLLGIIGAVVVMGAMLVLGIAVYVLVFQRRLNRLRAVEGTGPMHPVTGPIPAVQAGDTGQIRTLPTQVDNLPDYTFDTDEVVTISDDDDTGPNPRVQE